MKIGFVIDRKSLLLKYFIIPELKSLNIALKSASKVEIQVIVRNYVYRYIGTSVYNYQLLARRFKHPVSDLQT